MKFTVDGKHLITISNENYGNLPEMKDKIHLIKLDFRVNYNNYSEIRNIVWNIFKKYKTKRFIVPGIDEEVKYWNKIFKTLKSQYKRYKWVFFKKFYVENEKDCNLFYFFKRHNKVLLDTTKLNEEDYQYLSKRLKGILPFVEIIKGDINFYEENKNVLLEWNGNFICDNEEKFLNYLQ